MKINEKKLQKQLSIIDAWIANGCKGTVEACTGFGKTYVLILVIIRLHKKYPNAYVDVVVPKINLYDDWTHPTKGHIVIHNLTNVNVFVVNTYIRFEKRFPALLGLDEVHNYASKEFGKVFEIANVEPIEISAGKIPFILGLTATLERLDGKEEFIEKYCPVIASVSLEEAKREGYISNYKIFNLGLHFVGEEKEQYDYLHTLFNKSFAKFEHNFPLAMACCKGKFMYSTVEVPVKEVRFNQSTLKQESHLVLKTFNKTTLEWCSWLAERQGWDGTAEHDWSPSKISEYAQQFNYSMRNRKQMIYKAQIKIDTIEEIVNKFPVKTITFCEDTEFADRIAERLGEHRCKSYHSKTKGRVERVESLTPKGKLQYKNKRISAENVKKEILQSFIDDDELQVLSAAKALDEGYDNKKVRMGIQSSYTSAKRQDTQRNGRPSRLDDEDEDKVAILINLYMIGSQEEKWLRKKQESRKDVNWITSVEDIILEDESLNLV